MIKVRNRLNSRWRLMQFFACALIISLLMPFMFSMTAFAAPQSFRLDASEYGGNASEKQKFDAVLALTKYKEIGEGGAGVIVGDDAEASTLVEARKIEGFGDSTALFIEDDGKYFFNAWSFESLSVKDQRRLMKDFLADCEKVSLSEESMGYIQENIQTVSTKAADIMLPLIFDSTKADLFGAFKVFAPFAGPIGIFLGIGASLLIAFLFIVTVLDLCFIGIPMVQETGLNQASNQGNGQGGGGSSAGRPRWVSLEAWSAVCEVEAGLSQDGGKFKSAYVLYFKRRVLAYIMLFICILYLVAGQLGGLIAALLHLVSGFSVA